MSGNRVIIHRSKIVAISDIVRQKLNETAQYTLDELPSAIRRIAKTEAPYTPEEIQEIASRDMVISAQTGDLYSHSDRDRIGTHSNYSNYGLGRESSYLVLRAGRKIFNIFTRHHNDGARKIGLIRGTLSDGSFCVSILGNGKLLREGSTSIPRPANKCNDFFTLGTSINCSFNVYIKRGENDYVRTSWPNDTSTRLYIKKDDCEPYWGGSTFNVYIDGQFRRSAIYTTNNYESGCIRKASALDFTLEWQPIGTSNIQYDWLYANGFLNCFGTKNGTLLPDNSGGNIQLTTDKNTTLTIGSLEEEFDYTDTKSYFCYNDGRSYLCGNLYDDLRVEADKFINEFDGKSYIASELGSGLYDLYSFDLADTLHGTYAAYNKLYNIPLTHNEAEALRYIEDGTLPSDVIIYPFNVEDINSNFIKED